MKLNKEMAEAISGLVILTVVVGGMFWIISRSPPTPITSITEELGYLFSPFVDMIEEDFPDEIDAARNMLNTVTSNTMLRSYSDQRRALVSELESLQMQRAQLAKVVSIERGILWTFLQENLEYQRRIKTRDNILSFLLGVASSLCATGLIVIGQRARKRISQPGH